MAKQERRGFSREFKLEAVRAATAGDKRVTDVARELGVNAEQIHRWRRLFEQRPELSASDMFPGNGKLTSQDEELRRLRQELAKVREERDILKKATAFFAKQLR